MATAHGMVYFIGAAIANAFIMVGTKILIVRTVIMKLDFVLGVTLIHVMVLIIMSHFAEHLIWLLECVFVLLNLIVFPGNILLMKSLPRCARRFVLQSRRAVAFAYDLLPGCADLPGRVVMAIP